MYIEDNAMKKEKRNIPITPHERLKRLYYFMFGLTIVLGIGNVIYLGYQPDTTVASIAFCVLQYAVMLALLTLPIIIRRRFLVNIPLLLIVVVAVFAFTAMIMGDGLNFYGKYPWWDSALHFLSGLVLAVLGLWILHLLFADDDSSVFKNRWFVGLYILFFGLGCGALWEIMEFSFDDIFGTNTQQYMETTTASIYTALDRPLEGHAALEDTMNDLFLDFFGSLMIAIYAFVNHDKLVEKHNALLSGDDSSSPLT